MKVLIESCKVNDITLSTLLKILQISGTLEGVMELVPELPESPFLILHDNQQYVIFCHVLKYFSIIICNFAPKIQIRVLQSSSEGLK